MHPYLAYALTAAYWIVYPVYWLVYTIVSLLGYVALYVLQSLYGVLRFVFQPAIVLLSFVSQVAYLPLDILMRFETLYIYIGIAIFVGLLAGVILHLIFRILTHVLGLGPSPRIRASALRRRPEPAQSHFMSPSSSDVPDTPIKSERPDEFTQRVLIRPELIIQAPSPEKRRFQRKTLLEQTMEVEGYESEL